MTTVLKLDAATVRFTVMTASSPGAIGIIQLHGNSVELLRSLTSVDDWPISRMRLVKFGDIDEGLAVRLNDHVAQLLPHGGPRVMQRLSAKLVALGAAPCRAEQLDVCELFPEAADRLEAIMLRAMARAESPLAIDLLLDQPRRWREQTGALSDGDRARSRRLNRLIEPPRVVVAGAPNVGKSTLSNALIGRTMSIAADMPGTTRDYTAARIDLGGVVVDWHDTPGLRETRDPIEARAIELARKLLASADVLISMTDSTNDWPHLPREPDVRVVNKADAGQRTRSAPGGIAISAKTGRNLDVLVRTVRDAIVPPEDLAHPGRWLFHSAMNDHENSQPD